MIFDGIHNVNGLMGKWVNGLMGNYLTLNASQPHQLINPFTHLPIHRSIKPLDFPPALL